MRRLALAALVSLLIFAISRSWSASAEPPAAEKLSVAISCTQPFKPEDVLIALQREGYIGQSPFRVVDGIPVFALQKPLRVRGLKIEFVEGWDFAGDLFVRAPGTAPGRFIGVTAVGNKADVEKTYWSAPEPESVVDGIEQSFDGHVIIDDKLAAYGYRTQDGLSAITCFLPDPFRPASE